MSDRSYNVVFEYDETMGGAYGNRFWTSYKNLEDFKAVFKDRPGQIIIAKGVTQAEALNLTSLTPEICRLMGAIEQIFEEDPRADQEFMNLALSNAK